MPLKLLRASLRNYKRVLLLSTGVILAVSLFAGINIGVEAISRGVLESFVQSIPYDMTYYQQDINTSYVQVNQQISADSDVVHVETVFTWSPYNQLNLSSTAVKDLQNPQIVLAGLSSDFASRYNVTLTQGNWNLTDGVILSGDLALLLKVKPGDLVNMGIGYYNSTAYPTNTSYWNTTIRVAGVVSYSQMAGSLISGDAYIPPPLYSGPGPVTFQSLPIAFDYNNLLSAFRAYSAQAARGDIYYYPSNLQISHRIFLNRDAVINLFDADATLARLTDIENRIQIDLGFRYGYLNNHLANAINGYRFWLQSSLTGFYFFSLPVLPISWYLAMTSWYMVTSRRRREFGLLKVRGISGRSIFRTAIMESLVIGVVGSILGLFVGFGVGAVVAMLLGSPPSFVIGLGALRPELLEVSLGLGAFISILAAIRPARLAASMEPTEAVKEYQGEEVEVGKPWRPTWTWAAVALGTYKMLEWIFNFSPMTLFPYGPPVGGNFFLSILFFVWISLSGILIALGPFLFVYGVTKLITRSQNRLYRSTVLILRFLVKDLANVTARALSRNPARASRVAFLIALTLTFGIFVNVVMASTWDLQVRAARLRLGADINVQGWMPGVNETFAANLTAIPGISQVSPIHSSCCYSTPYSGVSGVSIFGINPQNYLDVAYRDEEFTVGAPEPLFQRMRTTPDAALLSAGLASFLKIKVGDTFQISQAPNGTSLQFSFAVIGFFRVLPGIGSVGPVVSGPGGFFSGGSVLASLSYLRSSGVMTPGSGGFTFLCRLNPNTDVEQVATTIRSLYGVGGAYVQTVQGRLRELTESAAQIAIFRFLQLTSAYLFVAAVMGFALISWANTRDRLGEIAIFRSRGTSRRQALQILFAESFSILLIAMIIGAATGIISAYGVLTFFTSVSSSFFSGLALRLVAPLELWLMIVASVAGFLLSIVISAWLCLRKTVIETVRFR